MMFRDSRRKITILYNDQSKGLTFIFKNRTVVLSKLASEFLASSIERKFLDENSESVEITDGISLHYHTNRFWFGRLPVSYEDMDDLVDFIYKYYKYILCKTPQIS